MVASITYPALVGEKGGFMCSLVREIRFLKEDIIMISIFLGACTIIGTIVGIASFVLYLFDRDRDR
jgi:hypothetical protein